MPPAAFCRAPWRMRWSMAVTSAGAPRVVRCRTKASRTAGPCSTGRPWLLSRRLAALEAREHRPTQRGGVRLDDGRGGGVRLLDDGNAADQRVDWRRRWNAVWRIARVVLLVDGHVSAELFGIWALLDTIIRLMLQRKRCWREDRQT